MNFTKRRVYNSWFYYTYTNNNGKTDIQHESWFYYTYTNNNGKTDIQHGLNNYLNVEIGYYYQNKLKGFWLDK